MIRIILLQSLILVSLNGVAQQANFSGTWVIDKERTVFGDVPQWILPTELMIAQKTDTLTVASMVMDPHMTVHTYSEAFPFNGGKTEVITYNGTKRDGSLKWDDQNIMISIESIMADNESGSSITEKWSLENGAKTLVVDRTTIQTNGRVYNIKGYYNKKD
jgi:hypothetical protein